MDFDLLIEEGKGREYPIRVISPAGEAHETLHWPYDDLSLENVLLNLRLALRCSGGPRRRVLAPELQAVRDFGGELFDELFIGEVRNRYDVTLEKAEAADQAVRVRLRILAPELATIPWEYLYDHRTDRYLALSTQTPVVRYLELPQPPHPLAVTPPLRILAVAVSPANLDPLNVDRERQRIEKALEDLIAQGRVEIHWLAKGTWRELQRALRRGPWHIFHFIGHGGFDRQRDEGLLAFENEKGQAHLLYATQLGRLLEGHRSLRLAFLNACEGAVGGEQDIFSSTAAGLVRKGIPAVVAMQYEIMDRAAIELARTFYEALADGYGVDAALAEARKAVDIAVPNTVEWGVPVLHLRAPDGCLFRLEGEARAAAGPLPADRPGETRVPAKAPVTAPPREAEVTEEESLQRQEQLTRDAQAALSHQDWEELRRVVESLQALDPELAGSFEQALAVHARDEQEQQERWAAWFAEAKEGLIEEDPQRALELLGRLQSEAPDYSGLVEMQKRARRVLRKQQRPRVPWGIPVWAWGVMGLVLVAGLTALLGPRLWGESRSSTPAAPAHVPESGASVVTTSGPQATATKAASEPQATATKAASEPQATVAATPPPIVCDEMPIRGFRYVWAEQAEVRQGLGCPSSYYYCVEGYCSGEQAMVSAVQRFEHGTMIWVSQPTWGNTCWVYVLFGDGTYQRFRDTFAAGVDPESDPDIVPPEGLYQPIRGFGKIWREETDARVRERLGWAIEPEQGGDAAWQEFQRGVMYWIGPVDHIYVIYEYDADYNPLHTYQEFTETF